MRYYKNKQAEMLNSTAMLLKMERDALTAKVPALKDLINEFVEKERHLHQVKILMPRRKLTETYQKVSVKDAFADVTMKLLSVAKTANYRNKNKPEEEKNYTLWDLKKLPAADLSKVHLAAFNKVKKIKNLSYYGLSAGDLKDAQAYYKEFSVIKNAPAKRKKDTALKNKMLNDAVKECIDFLMHTIDPLMLIATEGNQSLTIRYKSVRKVLARGQGRPSEAEIAYRKSRLPKKV